MSASILKETAKLFLSLCATGKAREAFRKFVADGFKHHNPYFAGDAVSLMQAMEESALANPNKIFDVKHVICEYNMVAIHSHVKQNEQDKGAAVMHIFRFQHEKIVELWDFGQAVPNEVMNSNGMF